MLKDKILEQWKDYYKSGSKLGRAALEAIKVKILVTEKSGEYKLPLEDSVIENLIIKEIKELKESQLYYDMQEHSQYWDIEAKINILSEYLPKQLSEDDVMNIIKDKMALESNTGRLIGIVVKEVGNRFDKSKIAQMVKNATANK